MSTERQTGMVSDKPTGLNSWNLLLYVAAAVVSSCDTVSFLCQILGPAKASNVHYSIMYLFRTLYTTQSK